MVEEWWLLDADLPLGTQIPFGEYELSAPAGDALPVGLDVDVFEASCFLRKRVRREPTRGFVVVGSEARPEHGIWRPLLALALWDRPIVRVGGLWEVDAGHHAREIQTWRLMVESLGGPGEEFDRAARGGYQVDSLHVANLAAFLQEVERRISIVELAGQQRAVGSVRWNRLQRAAYHLARSAQRTIFGKWVEEVDEVVLHHVIAIEAILADEKQADLARKVCQRAAVIAGDSDDERLGINRLLSGAYAERSEYVHGGTPGQRVDLPQLRNVVLKVILRWLVSVTHDDASDKRPLAEALDRALLSDFDPSECRNRSLAKVPRGDWGIPPVAAAC